MTLPSRRALLLSAAALAACVVSFLAGKFTTKPEVRTVTKTEVQTVTLYATHATTTTTDKGRERVVTVTRKEPGGTVFITKTSERANDLRLDLNWTAVESNRASEKAEATTTSTSSRPGWSVGASALWSPGHLSAKPQTYTLELDRRLVGTLWVGARVNTDKQAGAAFRLEW